MAANLLVLAVLSSVFPTHRIAFQVAVAGALYHSDNSPERMLLLSHVLQHHCLGRQVVMLDLQLWWMHYKLQGHSSLELQSNTVEVEYRYLVINAYAPVYTENHQIVKISDEVEKRLVLVDFNFNFFQVINP